MSNQVPEASQAPEAGKQLSWPEANFRCVGKALKGEVLGVLPIIPKQREASGTIPKVDRFFGRTSDYHPFNVPQPDGTTKKISIADSSMAIALGGTDGQPLLENSADSRFHLQFACEEGSNQFEPVLTRMQEVDGKLVQTQITGSRIMTPKNRPEAVRKTLEERLGEDITDDSYFEGVYQYTFAQSFDGVVAGRYADLNNPKAKIFSTVTIIIEKGFYQILTDNRRYTQNSDITDQLVLAQVDSYNETKRVRSEYVARPKMAEAATPEKEILPQPSTILDHMGGEAVYRNVLEAEAAKHYGSKETDRQLFIERRLAFATQNPAAVLDYASLNSGHYNPDIKDIIVYHSIIFV